MWRCDIPDSNGVQQSIYMLSLGQGQQVFSELMYDFLFTLSLFYCFV